MPKALYHQHGSPVELDVIAKHADGTVDLGRGETVLVSRCLVVDAPAHGAATIEKPTAKPAGKQSGKSETE